MRPAFRAACKKSDPKTCFKVATSKLADSPPNRANLFDYDCPNYAVYPLAGSGDHPVFVLCNGFSALNSCGLARSPHEHMYPLAGIVCSLANGYSLPRSEGNLAAEARMLNHANRRDYCSQ
jgi:hypothetical protein